MTVAVMVALVTSDVSIGEDVPDDAPTAKADLSGPGVGSQYSLSGPSEEDGVKVGTDGHTGTVTHYAVFNDGGWVAWKGELQTPVKLDNVDNVVVTGASFSLM